MKKTSNKIVQNVFEQLKDLTIETGKATAKAINETFNPLDALMKSDNNSSNLKETSNQRKNHKPLDFENLQKKYQDKEKIAQEALRQRLFQMVRQGEQQVAQEKKQKELEKKRQEAWEEEQRKRKQEEEKRQQQTAIPMGKIRRSIFSPKKVAQRQHIETKAASGKQ